MSFRSLPHELLYTVCRTVCRKDLPKISRTSTWLYPIAQRLLYRDVCLSAHHKNLSVVITLSKRPELARYVRSFFISLEDVYSHVFSAYYHQLAKALAYMTELVKLDLLIDSGCSWILRSTRDEYRSLQTFCCSFPLDGHVSEFLGKTPNLRELEADSIPSCLSTPIQPIPMAFVPRLTHFIGSCRAAIAIVPGRPVGYVHLNSGDLEEDEIVAFSQGTAPLEIFVGSIRSLPASFLDLLASYLSKLVYLRIMTTHTFTKAPEANFYKEIAHRLAAFPELRSFELSGMIWGSQKKSGDRNERVWQSAPLGVSPPTIEL